MLKPRAELLTVGSVGFVLLNFLTGRGSTVQKVGFQHHGAPWHSIYKTTTKSYFAPGKENRCGTAGPHGNNHKAGIVPPLGHHPRTAAPRV